METEFFDLVLADEDGHPLPTPDVRCGLAVVGIVRSCDQLLLRCRRPWAPLEVFPLRDRGSGSG